MTILRILASAWRNGKKPCNSLTHETYLQSRVEAAQRGVNAKLYWNGKPVMVDEYLRLLTLSYEDEASVLDLPKDVAEVFSLLEKGWNNAEAIRHAAIESRIRLGRGWEKNMAVKMASAMETLLNGGSLKNYHRSLGLESLPD
jgi:hypothetical protein